MPRIVQYTAPTEALTESTRGTAAFEQAGRRLGPLYNQAATYQKEQGKITAEEYKDLQWPYDIAKLNESRATGINATVTGGRSTQGGSYRGSAPSYDGTGQISRGAGALGNALRDGGYTLASSKTPEAQTLEGGNLITVSQDNKLTGLYNTAIDKSVSQNTNDAVNTRDYWTKYNGSNPYATDQSGVSSTGPQGVNAPGGPDNIYGTTVYNDVSAPDTTASTGYFSGLSNWVDSTAGTSTSDAGGDVTQTTDTGL